jgi:hypothetical protein
LEERFARVLALISRLEHVPLDPANSANVVTDDLEWPRKRAVAESASRALAADAWARVV